MKYIDKFANISSFLKSDLQKIEGDRIAVIDGFELPILKKKSKMVVDPSTNEEVEELQDVWMTPVGEVEEKVEHKYTIKCFWGKDRLSNGELEVTRFGYDSSNYSTMYTEIGNFYGGTHYVEDTSVQVSAPSGDSIVTWSLACALYDYGKEIPRHTRCQVQTYGAGKWWPQGNSGEVTKNINGSNITASVRTQYTYNEETFKLEFNVLGIPNTAGTYTVDFANILRFVIDGEEYYLPSFTTNIVVSNQGESPLRSLVEFNGNAIRKGLPAGVDVSYLGNYNYEIDLPNGTDLSSCNNIFDYHFGHHFTDDRLESQSQKAFLMSSSGTQVASVYNDGSTNIDVDIVDWNNQYNQYWGDIQYSSSNFPDILIFKKTSVFESTTDATYEFDVPFVEILSGGSQTKDDYRYNFRFPGTTKDSNTPYVWVANTMIFKNNLHFKVKYGNGGTQAQDSDAVLVLGTMTDMSDNSATLNIANGTAGNAGASSKNFKLVCWNTDGNGNLITVNGSQYQTIDVNDVDVSVSSNPSGADYSVQKLSNSIDVYFGDQNTSSNNANKSVEYTITFTYGELSLSYTVDVDWCVIITENEPDRSSDGEGYRGNTTIKKVIVSEGVTSLGESAFNGCTNLEEVTLPSTFTRLGLGCFIGTKITSITIPNGCRGDNDDPNNANYGHLGYATFMNCSSLTSVSIPSTITAIDRQCFNGCTNLTSITLPNSITNIGVFAFTETGLTSIEIPQNCTYQSNSFPAGCTVTVATAE